jgi:hypothetical protein
MKRDGATIARTLVYAAMNARRALAIEAVGVAGCGRSRAGRSRADPQHVDEFWS